MKKLFFSLLLSVIALCSHAQLFNNEWIDYSKTYYKFKLGSTGIYRIPQTALASAGLATDSVQYFQLWRHGEEVPLYTSLDSGVLDGTGYLEFYGEMNDGKLDTRLYKTDALQMADKYSLYTDTASYFLTVNTTSPNQRLIVTGNDVANNILPPEAYFTYQLDRYQKANQNPGYGYFLGELIHAASYESGEGWTSNNIAPGYPLFENNNPLYLHTSGPPAKLSAVVVGNENNNRTVTIKINGYTLASAYVTGYDIKRFDISNIPLTDFNGDYATFSAAGNGPSGDYIMLSGYTLTYPRKFNFGGQSQFYFELPASEEEKYLEIANFSYGSSAPVLYDLSNNLRLTTVVSGGLVKVVLPPSSYDRRLVLLSTDPTKIKTVAGFTPRNFVDYSLPQNQGDYMIISHTTLFDDGNGNNNVEKYRAYRSSTEGGSYNSKTVDIDQLTDQFSFGVKHHPSAIRNFSAFALQNFAVAPKYFFLIGKGLSYVALKYHESDPNINKLALVPTFGYPSSDNLLTATRSGEYPVIPIGRLSAVSGAEVGTYLDKMKQFEQAQQSTSETIADKAWMKNMAQITGGLNDAGLFGLITSYMQGYEQIAADTLFGAKVYQFSKNTGSNMAAGSTKTMNDVFNEGLSLLTYFGHSSPNTIEFNLDNPENYNNTGKYPLIIVNGCNSGDLFQFDTSRAFSKGSLSEKFVFAAQKGAIGYIASTHFGLPAELNFVNTEFYENLCKKMYGQSIGSIMQSTMKNVYALYGNNYIIQSHVEEITLHGDPAMRLNPHDRPDYVIQDSLVSFNPSVISVADNKVTINAKILNIGKGIGDSVAVRVEHQFPDNSIEVLFNGKIKAIPYENTISLELPLNPVKNNGLNHIIVTIDPDNLITEFSETNNTVTKDFTIIEDEIRPIWPYEFAIVNNPAEALYGSTANPVTGVKEYVMELDTTAAFNSPFKIVRSVSDSGGVIKFIPGISFTDSTVYYWRVAVGPVTANTRWLDRSFTYINGAEEGFNQSHYYQFKKDDYSSIMLDSASRKFQFDDQTRRLLVRTGLYPYYNWDQINVNIDDDQKDYYGCTYAALQIVVYDPLTLNPWKNTNTGNFGRFGSRPVCNQYDGGFRYFFEFSYDDTAYRRKAMQFFDSIPAGYYVSITNLGYTGNTTFIDKWKSDTTRLGSGKSLWHKFHQLGFNTIDSFTTNLPFLYVFKKGDAVNFPLYQSMGPLVNTQISNAYYIAGKKVSGTVTTPWIGPVKEWKDFKWNRIADPSSTTVKYFDVIGKDINGNDEVLATVNSATDTSLSFIDAALYPYLKLRMNNQDPQNAQTIQLKYWMLTANLLPEGGVSPNMALKVKDSLMLSDTLHFKVGFKNVSNIAFDSIKVRLTITDAEGVAHSYDNLAGGVKISPLAGEDSVIISYDLPVNAYAGDNQLFLEINPDNDQREQYHFNNYLYRSFYVSNEICPGGSISFSAGPIVNGNTYQWQVDDGTGYTNLSNNAIYGGVNGRILSLITPPSDMYGYKYKCVITNNAIISGSTQYTLKFAMSWNGIADNNWSNTANWVCGVLPDEHTDVIVTEGLTHYPVITGNAVCRTIKLKPNTSVTVNAGANLAIKGAPAN